MASALTTSLVLLGLAAPWTHQGMWGSLAQAPVFPEQRQALVELYLACNGSSWSSLNQDGWSDYLNPNISPCGWTGISCQTDYSENQSFILYVQEAEGGGACTCALAPAGLVPANFVHGFGPDLLCAAVVCR